MSEFIRKYVREDGRIVQVVSGLAGTWIVGSISPSGGHKKIKSPRLPPRRDRAQAEQDLRLYAESKGWQPYDGTMMRRIQLGVSSRKG